MKTPLAPGQIETLTTLASASEPVLVPQRTAKSLVERGLARALRGRLSTADPDLSNMLTVERPAARGGKGMRFEAVQCEITDAGREALARLDPLVAVAHRAVQETPK